MTSSLKKKFEELVKLTQDLPEEPPPISDEKRDKILSDRLRIPTFLTGKLCNLCDMEIPDDQEHADENECIIAKIHNS